MQIVTKQQFLKSAEWAISIFVAGYMLVYGGGKFIQFGDISAYTQPLNSYKGMELMWAFYSYSKTYAVLLGILEIAGSVLLLIPKFRLIGGVLLSTILVNIILQDAFYGVHLGAML